MTSYKVLWNWILFALLALCALEALYLAAGNWALKSGALARLLSRKPARFQVEWTSGRTVWPGIFHFEGVRIRGQSERMQTCILADRCTFRIHLFMLASCRVHFYDVEGQGISLRMRHRREPGKPHPTDRYDPPIPGLEQDAPPPPRKNYPSPWSLHFGSAEIKDLREIWIGPYKITGRGRAAGDASYRLRGPIEVRGATLGMEGAEINMGQEVIASDLQVEMGAQVHGVVPREHRGRPFLRFVSGRCQARGNITSLGFLNEAIGEHAPLVFKGRGQLSADVTIDRGVMSPGSKISWDGEELSASSSGFSVSGRGSLSGGTEAGDPAFSLVARWSDITILRDGLPPITLDGPGLSAELSGPRLDLASDARELAVALDLPDSKIRDLSVLGPLIPPKAPLAILHDSPAVIRAHMELQGPRAMGGLTVEGDGVGIRLGDQVLRGGFYAEIKVKEGDIPSRAFDISGTRVGFSKAVFSGAGSPSKDDFWSGEAMISEGRIHTTVPGAMSVKVKLKMADTRPAVALFAANYKSVRWFKGFLDIKDVTGSAALSVEGQTAIFDSVDVEGKGLQMLAWMRLRGGRMDGAFYGKLHHLSAAVSIENGERRWKLVNARKWYDALP